MQCSVGAKELAENFDSVRAGLFLCTREVLDRQSRLPGSGRLLATVADARTRVHLLGCTLRPGTATGSSAELRAFLEAYSSSSERCDQLLEIELYSACRAKGMPLTTCAQSRGMSCHGRGKKTEAAAGLSLRVMPSWLSHPRQGSCGGPNVTAHASLTSIASSERVLARSPQIQSLGKLCRALEK